MVTGIKRGATFHVDYWEGWSPTVKATWQKVCLEGHLSCSSGDLGNGTELINAGEPLASYGKHELVDLATLTSVPAPARLRLRLRRLRRQRPRSARTGR